MINYIRQEWCPSCRVFHFSFGKDRNSFSNKDCIYCQIEKSKKANFIWLLILLPYVISSVADVVFDFLNTKTFFSDFSFIYGLLLIFILSLFNFHEKKVSKENKSK